MPTCPIEPPNLMQIKVLIETVVEEQVAQAEKVTS